ncbi:hypothetical protein O9K51_02852 [Purpureocillium lavendulum]|uniref:Uncharacterized protein n=1 Tax=Purpureocillium lavendulum TaxID=1247861 RepID=A0AB34FZJ7_9HYPO|nr:hypothetical protein O9K51_02852 [Purpureocillium lavendulum]
MALPSNIPRTRRVRTLAAAATLAVVAVAFKYKSDAYRENEVIQRNHRAPNAFGRDAPVVTEHATSTISV